MIDWIIYFIHNSLVNYGVISYKRSQGKDKLNLLIHLACGCILMPLLDNSDSTAMRVAQVICVVLVYAGAFAGSLFGSGIPHVGRYTILNHVVTFAAGLITAIVTYGISVLIIYKSFSYSYISIWFSSYITILVFSAVIPWLIGFVKSFHVSGAMDLMTEDDGVVEVERTFGHRVKKSFITGDYYVTPIGWKERRWTAQTYQHNFRILCLFAKWIFALFYGITVGCVLAGIGTISSIVRAANPGAPFEGFIRAR